MSNHRQAVDDLKDCENHITVSVPDQSQRVEFLIDSISRNDTALQAAIGLVRANTNNMRHDFEVAASALINWTHTASPNVVVAVVALDKYQQSITLLVVVLLPSLAS